MTSYSLTSVIAAGLVQAYIWAAMPGAPVMSPTLVTETPRDLNPDDYPGTADDLASKLIRIVDMPQRQLKAKGVENVLGVHLTEVKPTSPRQSKYAFYEAKAGKDWYFAVMLSEWHPDYPMMFHVAYPHLIRSSSFCIPLQQLAKGLAESGYFPSETKALEPENPELVFYKEGAEVQVGYDL